MSRKSPVKAAGKLPLMPRRLTLGHADNSEVSGSWRLRTSSTSSSGGTSADGCCSDSGSLTGIGSTDFGDSGIDGNADFGGPPRCVG